MPKPFIKNDPRINRKGRPTKEYSITQGLRDFMLAKDPKTKRGIRELFVEKLVGMALKGDRTALRLVLEYVDGKPRPIEDPVEEKEFNNEVVIQYISPEGKYTEEEVEQRVRDRLAELEKNK